MMNEETHGCSSNFIHYDFGKIKWLTYCGLSIYRGPLSLRDKGEIKATSVRFVDEDDLKDLIKLETVTCTACVLLKFAEDANV